MAGNERYMDSTSGEQLKASSFCFADLHGHTELSDGVSTPEHIVRRAMDRGLSAVAVTDHNTPEGGKRAEEYAQQIGRPNYVIVGSEVSSNGGHIVALNTRHQIPRDLSIEETNYRIHRVGGLAVAVHPGVGLVNGVSLDAIKKAQDNGSPFDAVELANGSVIRLRETPVKGKKYLPRSEQEASDRFYLQYGLKNGLAGVGGSDYHGHDVGYSVTAYQELDVLAAIQNRTTRAAIRNDIRKGWLMEIFYLKLGELKKRLRGKSKV